MDGVNRPRRVIASPPADFPVYGLDVSWPGSRWLELFGEALGDPVSWVALGHRGLGGEPLILVETFSRPRTDALVSSSSRAPLEHVAQSAASTLVNVTLPEPSLPRPDGLLRALVNHAHEQGAECAQWRLIRWQVDGAAVAARSWAFAGGWAAITDAVPDVYLAAIGVSADPDVLSLAMLHDGSAYHFDLSQQLDPSAMAASRQRAGGDVPEPHRQDWHPDQLRLVSH